MVGKKAIFFTIIGIFIVAIMMVYVSISTYDYQRDDISVMRMRFSTVENFIETFEEDILGRSLYVTSRSALDAVVEVMRPGATLDGGNPIVLSNIYNTQLAFEEAIVDGKLTASAVGPTINLTNLENYTLSDWLDNLFSFVESTTKIKMNYTINYLNITQNESDGPWYVSVWVNLDYSINDSANDMFWTRTNISAHARIPIEGVRDPFIKYQTFGFLNRTIKRFNHSGLSMYPEDLKRMLDEGTYVFDPESTSFLQRFKINDSNTSSSCCGIMSLVKSSDLTIYDPLSGSPTYHANLRETRNYVDAWYYYPKCTGDRLYSINNLSGLVNYSNFRLGEHHLEHLSVDPNSTVLRSDEDHDPCGSQDPYSGVPVLPTSDICGDGIVGGSESCDDGDIIPGDGCSATCNIELGFACVGEPSVCSCIDTDGDGLCNSIEIDDDNDGVVDGADTNPLNPDICEDSDGDGCDDCSVGTDDYGPLPDNNPLDDGTDVDGDGHCVLTDCDDNNPLVNMGLPENCFDGIDNDCDTSIDGADSDCVGSTCGDSTVTGSEVCDDGYTTPCGVCNADCSGLGSGSTCGDSIVCQDTEGCDDGNFVNGDGCNMACGVEPSYTCVGEPSVCN